MIKLINSDTKSVEYSKILKHLFDKENEKTCDFTYTYELFKNRTLSLNFQKILWNIKNKFEFIFRKYGAIEVQTPLLMPSYSANFSYTNTC